MGDGATFEPRSYSEATAREIDLTVRELVDGAYERAKQILDGRRGELEDGAKLLLEKETLEPADFAPLKPADDREAAA